MTVITRVDWGMWRGWWWDLLDIQVYYPSFNGTISNIMWIFLILTWPITVEPIFHISQLFTIKLYVAVKVKHFSHFTKNGSHFTNIFLSSIYVCMAWIRILKYLSWFYRKGEEGTSLFWCYLWNRLNHNGHPIF